MYKCIYCNKECNTTNSIKNHERLCKLNPNRQSSGFDFINNTKFFCEFCGSGFTKGNFKKHINSCNLNPSFLDANRKECVVCATVYYKNTETCSHACSNKLFRSGAKNGNWNGNNYQSICFSEHGKKCLVCDETKIVAAHHVNEDHTDNRPENIVPLCPTHHQYVHSRYKNEIQPIIDNYLYTKYNSSLAK